MKKVRRSLVLPLILLACLIGFAGVHNPSAGGGSTTVSNLTDTVITSSAIGDLLRWDGTNWVNAELMLSSNRTVTIATGQTSGAIQALIDAQPKNLNGFELTFQFGAETITVTNSLTFTGFYAGTTYILGLDTTAGLNTNQSSVFDGSASAVRVFTISNCAAKMELRNLKVLYDSATNQRGIFVNACIVLWIKNSWMVGEANTGTSDGSAILLNSTVSAQVGGTYFTDGGYGLFCLQASSLLSNGNDDNGNQPFNGLLSSASIVFKQSTQITGANLDEVTSNGGQIY